MSTRRTIRPGAATDCCSCSNCPACDPRCAVCAQQRIERLEGALRLILSGDYDGCVIKGAQRIAAEALDGDIATLCACGHADHCGTACSHRDPEDGVGCDCTNGYETQVGGAR